ncbi:MAG: WecB/TagA/CpsF family glycosyltransferase [Deltaproteobacteria bacterium]|nr:WecB/TagA/CpsF family glycosyltransferase [Deltaproteobacteria bacterium]
MSANQAETLRRLGADGFEVRNLFGFPILAVTMEQVADVAERAIRERVRFITGQISGPMVVRMQRDGQLRESVMGADVFFADGAGIVFASRVLGRPLPERVAGIDLMYRLMERADRHGYRVYLFGAKQEVLERVVEAFGAKYPGAKLVGHQHGYFSAAEERGIAEAIRDARPDILFVAITTPKKENFLARWADLMAVPVLHGVGGSFDVVAGMVKRAPMVWQKLGMEWAYRIVQEPKRNWRREGISNLLFVGLVAWELAADLLKPE